MKRRPRPLAPAPLHAWGGTNERPGHSRMNLAFGKYYDRVIGALHRRGMRAHILINAYNKAVKWRARGSVEEDLFFRWLVAPAIFHATVPR